MHLATLFARLGRFFGLRRPSPPLADAARSEPAQAAPPPRFGHLDPLKFVSLLVGMARHDRLKDQRLHVFSLRDFRKATGGKWDRISDLVGVAVNQIMESHIDPAKDLFTRLDAETACLMLPGTSRQHARVRVAAIARDLTAQLVGDTVINGWHPQVVTANVALSSVVDGDGALRPAAIQQALSEAGAAFADPAGEPMQALLAGTLDAPHRTTLAALLAPGTGRQPDDGDIAYANALAAVPPDEAPDWLAVQRLQGGPLPAMKSQRKGKGADWAAVWQTKQLRQNSSGDQLPAMEVRRGGADQSTATLWLDHQLADDARSAMSASAHLRPETSLTLLWTPTWVTNRRAIAAFQARVVRVDGDGPSPLEGTYAYADTSPIEALTLDRFTASQAARELTGLYLGRQRVGLTLPVRWTSLAPRWRDCIRLPLEQCPVAARRRFLKIEIFGLSPAIPPNILRDLFAPLEKLQCDIIGRLPLSAIDMIPTLRDLRAVGVDLAELEDNDRVGDDELFARLCRFRDAARRARMACYVWGARRRPLIAKVVGGGFSLVSGPGVMSDIGRPHASALATVSE
jgi:hypothetical protein